ncbi:MAG: diguanylate cyclase [Methylobacter sp.]|nr:diguanylate cyclase [Methylobacter sp.]
MSENLTFFPEYNASLEEISEYIKRIIPLMSKHKIAIDPLNFTVFYEYIAGRNISLNHEIDMLLSTQTVFTSKLNLNLFNKHICNISLKSLEKINCNLLNLINNTSEAIDITGVKANAATIHFQSYSKKLEDNQGVSDIKMILTEIMTETLNLAATSSILQDQLDKSAIELNLLRQELAETNEMAKTDALTGLFNRRTFDQKLDEHINTNKQDNSELCLLLLDLDHFKKVNDTFGHQVGDNVLRYTANLMKQHIIDHHYAARYGGEEMAIIMPDTPFNKAMEIAEKIRGALAKHPLKRKDSKESIGIVTVSIGVSSLKPNDSIETLVERADKAMYLAKKNGRNQVMAESLVNLA